MKLALPHDIRTPAYVLDEAALKRNLARAARIKSEAGCKILLATKAFAMPAAFPLMRDVLDGTTASGEYEARLGHDEFGKEVHVYSPAYTDGEVERLTKLADHIYFNSPEQIAKNLPVVKRHPDRRSASASIPAIRTRHSAARSTIRARPTRASARRATRSTACRGSTIDILHVHALCESWRCRLRRPDRARRARSSPTYIRRVKAVNFGGGHFINKPGYDVDKLIAAIKAFRAAFDVEVILEPGAGLVVDTGYLVATVLDIHRNEKDIAILDASASTHMPDVLEVPYTPPILGAGAPGVHPHSYILGGKTCMTGDIIGEYSFDKPLKPGDRIVFGDMMQYSFVKNNTFNGTPLPDLAILSEDGSYRVVRSFGYEDFRHRLG